MYAAVRFLGFDPWEMQLPNLWVFMMVMVASDRPSWQRDCSRTALETIRLL